MKKELKVARCNDIQYMLMYALPLQMIRAEPSATDWYMQNYLQHWGCLSQKGLILAFRDAISYLPPDLYQNDYFHLECIDLQSLSLKQGITEYLKSRIDRNIYVILFVNENLLPGVLHEEGFFPHEYLVYGYDTLTETFKCVGMNQLGHMDYMEFTYQDIERSFESYIRTERKPKMFTFRTGDFFFVKKNRDFFFVPDYNREIVLHKLEQFISERPEFQAVPISNIRFFWGAGLLDGFRTYLEEERKDPLDYRHPFFFMDQAFLIHQRLTYLLEHEEADGLENLNQKYEEIVRLLTLMKNRYLKMWKLPEDRIEYSELCDSVKRMLTQIKELEIDMIEAVIRSIKS